MELLIIRHGQTFANEQKLYLGQSDVLLSSQGRNCLQRVDIEYDLIISSPLKRCVETARIMFEYQYIVLIADLMEIDFGDFENKSHKQLESNPSYQQFLVDAKIIPNGESVEGFKKRVIDFIDKLIKAYCRTDFRIVIVTHGGVIRTVLETYCNKKFFEIAIPYGEGYLLEINNLMQIVRSVKYGK